MDKKKFNDEIDIAEVFLIIWKKKWIVFLTIIIALALMLISELYKKPSKILIKSEINPINSYVEAEYKIFNSVLQSLKPYLFNLNVIENQYTSLTKLESNSENNFINMRDGDYLNGFLFNDIDKIFLYNLFIDKINKKEFMVSVIKNSDFIDKDNYSTKKEYENAAANIASLIKIKKDISISRNNNDKLVYNSIQFSVNENDIERWKNFLRFLEKNVNDQLRYDFHEIIDVYLNYADKLKKYRLEDINNQISVTSSEREISLLERKKKSFLADKYTERLKNLFDNSPISMSNDNFYAAKINYDLSNYEIKSSDLKKNAFIAVVLGLIFGVLFALLSNAIQGRK